jgi:hypothetical protein
MIIQAIGYYVLFETTCICEFEYQFETKYYVVFFINSLNISSLSK